MWNKEVETCALAWSAVASVLNHTDPEKVDLKLVLVDNSSPVQASWVGSSPNWDLVLLSENRGFGPAVNLGAKIHPDTDFVCQMNSDCEFVEDTINLLIGAMVKYDLDVGMPEHFENCKHYGLDKSDDVMGRDWRFGAFWIARRAAWEAVGGFDESFEMCYWEDTDLWRSIESTGRKVAGWRGTWVKHAGGASSHPRRDEFFKANKERFEEKWGRR
jgi:GT2 family glycosyltransferase